MVLKPVCVVNLIAFSERKTSVFNSNVQAVTSNTRKITSESREFASKLDDFLKLSKQHVSNVRSEADQYRQKEIEALAGISAKINQQVDKFQEILKVIRAKEETSDEAVENLQFTVDQTQEDIKIAFESWADGVRGRCETTCQEAEAAASAGYSVVRAKIPSTPAHTHRRCYLGGESLQVSGVNY